MRTNQVASFLGGLFFTTAVAFAASEQPMDLATVVGIEHLQVSASSRTLLAKNGFVVEPRYYRRIFSPYYTKALPHFVTADSVHNTFHVIFEDELKRLEAGFVDDLCTLSVKMAAAFHNVRQRYTLAPGSPQECALALANDYFCIAVALLETPTNTLKFTAANKTTVHKEIALIQAAAGVAPSPLFGYEVDYTQFKPRGFYTQSPVLRRYFMAASWYGNVAFRQCSERETRAALEIGLTLQAIPDALKIWIDVDTVYTHLLGSCDDLTPPEYADAAQGLSSATREADRIGEFTARVRRLRNPRVNSMVLTPKQMRDWVPLAKGMRFLGKRYLPDSELFMNVTDPKVEGRSFPSGLDVMAANGSARALQLLKAGRDHQKGIAASAAVLNTVKSEKVPSHYALTFKVAETLTAPAHPSSAPFARTPAYQDKNLMTALASWAAMRHSWQLHAKQTVTCCGLEKYEPSPGYVEPNPGFFDAMRELNRRTTAIFTNRPNVNLDRFAKFGVLLDQLAAIVDKQFAGQPLSEAEIALLDRYSNTIGSLQGFHFNMDADTAYPWMALISDVHSEMWSAKCVQVGTGGAMPIYAIVEHKGRPHLLIGAVYSYFEFTQPVSNRLTDEAWRARWSAGKIPRLPSWTQSFAGGHDPDAILRRLQQGQEVNEVLQVDDPRMDAFLAAALKSDKMLTGNTNATWLVEVAAIKLGRAAWPDLWRLVREAKVTRMVKEGDASRHERGPALAAAVALGRLATTNDISDILALAQTADPARGALFRNVAFSLDARVLESLIKVAVEQGVDIRVFQDLVDVLPRCSEDVTPHLLALARKAVASKEVFFLIEILDALAGIWDTESAPFYYARPPSAASESDLRRWAADIEALCVELRPGGNGKDNGRERIDKLLATVRARQK